VRRTVPASGWVHSLTHCLCACVCRYVALPTMTFNDDTVAWVMENVVLKGEDIVPDNVRSNASRCMHACVSVCVHVRVCQCPCLCM
jgi:hypothetical protein